MSYIFAILGLGLLVLVHEAGHMWAARWCGMRVEKFSIFFGPTILRWKRGETLYQLGILPFGGFVQIAGMNPHDEVAPDDPGSYQNKTAGQKFISVFAGPFVNYIFAIVLMLLVAFVWGIPKWTMTVDRVEPNTPAATAGVASGDVIISVSGKPVAGVEDVLNAISNSGGNAMPLVVQRGGKEQTLQVIPKKDGGGYRIGIAFGRKLGFSSESVGQRIALSFSYPLVESQRVLAGLKRLVTGQASTKQVGGPLEIVRQLKLSFEDSFAMAVLFLAMLNVYLGLFNLLPLPALDGGRLVFLAYTMIMRRPVNQRFENAVHMTGMVLLLGLILLVTFRDISRFIGH